jgi:nicotinamidase-related amidase
VIDVQKISLKYIPENDIEPALNAINMNIEKFRNHDCPVIRIYHHNPQLQGDWTEDFEFPESVKIEASDPKIVKTRPDAFHNTELNDLLKRLGCNTLFVCGLSATGCALATWIGAFNYDIMLF